MRRILDRRTAGRHAAGALGLLLASATSGGCLGAPSTLPPCDGWNTETVICDLMNPEDLDWLPGGEWVVVSEMTHADPARGDGDAAFVPGRLTAIRAPGSGRGLERRPLFPREWSEAPPDPARWGEPDCPGPPGPDDFAPHGLGVGPGPGGRPALAVVTHGAREVIDLFEVLEGSEPAIEWRGCVAVPEETSANDVALFGRGGLFASGFMPRIDGIGPRALWNLMKIAFGGETGSLLRWTPRGGMHALPGSGASAPNGVLASPDGETVWLAEWGGERILRLGIAGQGRNAAVVRRDAVAIEGRPDNLSWRDDGGILVASQRAGVLKALSCGAIDDGGCDVGYVVSRLDPHALALQPLAEGRGAASVALEVGDELWVGFFAGDSIARIPVADRRPD